MANVIPKGAKWVKDKVVSFDPTSSQVATASSGKLDYDYLVVASGILRLKFSILLKIITPLFIVLDFYCFARQRDVVHTDYNRSSTQLGKY